MGDREPGPRVGRPTRGRPLIMAYGRLHPFKGLDLLVRAMAAVPDAVLAVVGPSLHLRPLGDTVAELRQPWKIVFEGPFGDLNILSNDACVTTIGHDHNPHMIELAHSMENVPAVPVAFAEALGAAPMKAAA